MNMFPLQIFPEGSLAASVTTTVWVGLWVVAFFNLRLGWTASGFVVPGYIAPLLLLRPVSAAVIVLESILTYLLVYWVSETFHCRKPWSSFFGRDRFFALVLTSILVRVAMDAWLLPEFISWLYIQYGIKLRHEQSLHSYGLIIVSLLANCLWKPGLAKGLATNGVTIGLTYLIIRFGLMEFTNFSVGNLQYLYEDIASSLLASPKAYIVLVTAAFIASWMNLAYGWDFNGILIPALLALQWYDPMKILISICESLIVLVVAIGVMKLPGFRRMTIEGSRKTLLFFNVTFGYRLFLGTLVPLVFPDAKPTDLFGFGYLLSTLLAIKAHQKGLLLRLLRATVQVSAVGTVVGTLVGFAMLYVPLGLLQADTLNTRSAEEETAQQPAKTLAEFVRRQQQRIYRARQPNTSQLPTFQQLEFFEAGLRALKRASQELPSETNLNSLDEARRHLDRAGFCLVDIENRYWGLCENQMPHGHGFYVVDRAAKSPLLVQVPVPLDEWATVEAGWCLFQKFHAKAICFGGTTRGNLPDGKADVLIQPQSMLSRFQRVFDEGGVLQVRGYSGQRLADLQAAHVTNEQIQPNVLWVRQSIPRGVDQRILEELIGDCAIHWQDSPLGNQLRDQSWGSFAELSLGRSSRRKLLSQLVPVDGRSIQVHKSDVPLRQFMRKLKSDIALRNSNHYQTPALEELLFCDEHILQPLLTLTNDPRFIAASADLRDRLLHPIANAAAAIHYRVTVISQGDRPAAIVISEEPTTVDRKYWGTLVLGIGLRNPMLITVVRPEAERDTFEYGLDLFLSQQAQLAFFAGTNPHANQDGSSDLVATRNRRSLLTLTQQVVQREFADQEFLSIQIRAFAKNAAADLLVANQIGSRNFPALPPMTQEVVESQLRSGLRVSYVDGRPEVSGYELSGAFLASAIGSSPYHEFTTLWLSPTLRSRLHSQADNRLQYAIFNALDVPTQRESLEDWIGKNSTLEDFEPAEETEALTLLCRFLRTNDVHALHRLQQRQPKWSWTRLIDPTTGQSFLAISDEAGPLAIVRLAVLQQMNVDVSFVDVITQAEMADFVVGVSDIIARGDLR